MSCQWLWYTFVKHNVDNQFYTRLVSSNSEWGSPICPHKVSGQHCAWFKMAACCKKKKNTHQTGRWRTELVSFILLKSSPVQSSYLSDESRKPISLPYKLLTSLFLSDLIWYAHAGMWHIQKTLTTCDIHLHTFNLYIRFCTLAIPTHHVQRTTST